MVEQAALTLDEHLPIAGEPLDPHLSIELTANLNLIYLNIAASMDNLAWALAYQYELLENLDENHPSTWRFVGLLNGKFLRALQAIGLQKLVKELDSFSTWYSDVRSFRDPFAHRIPLYVPPSVYSENDIEERARLDKEAAEHFARDEDELGMEKMHEIRRLGTYMPAFIAEGEQIKVYNLGLKITDDIASWYQLSSLVMSEAFDM